MPILGAYVVPHPPILIPEVGRGEEQKIALTAAAYEKVAREIRELKPETIILTTPHLILYQDYFHIAPGQAGIGDFSRFGAAEVHLETPYDRSFILDLSLALAEADFPAGTEGADDPVMDHATTVPLYFITKEYQDFQLVRIGLSGLSLADHYRLGMYVRETVDRLDRRVVFLASGDLSHYLTEDGPYGFDPNGPLYDEKIMDILSRSAFHEILTMDPALYGPAGECGHRSFAIMAGALDRTGVTARKLSYEGPFGVGYGIVAFDLSGEDPTRNFLDQNQKQHIQDREESKKSASPHARLALAVMEASLEGRPFDMEAFTDRSGLPEEMLSEAAGVFVTLHKNGQLRGCIGTLAPATDSVAEEIRRNAIESAFHDPRFPPVTLEEFSQLDVSVDVLMPPEAVRSLAELDPLSYGVIVTCGERRGLLLPDLEGITTAEEQVSIARAKAGIGESDPVDLQRFKVVRHI